MGAFCVHSGRVGRAHLRRRCIHDGRLAGHGDRFRQRAHFQHDVQFHDRTDGNWNTLVAQRAEALKHVFKVVVARRKNGEAIGACLRRHSGWRARNAGAPNGDRHAGQDGAGLIRDFAEDFTCGPLRGGRHREEKGHEKHTRRL